MKELNRRDFIYYSGSAAILLCLPFLSCERPKGTQVLKNPRALLKTFPFKTIEELGKSYLEMNPKESNTTTLVQLIVDDRTHLNTKTSDIQDIISNKITLDFRESRITMVNGVIISITEARQCALFYLNY